MRVNGSIAAVVASIVARVRIIAIILASLGLAHGENGGRHSGTRESKREKRQSNKLTHWYLLFINIQAEKLEHIFAAAQKIGHDGAVASHTAVIYVWIDCLFLREKFPRPGLSASSSPRLRAGGAAALRPRERRSSGGIRLLIRCSGDAVR